jgi:hypothetical protein
VVQVIQNVHENQIDLLDQGGQAVQVNPNAPLVLDSLGGLETQIFREILIVL